MNYRSTWIRTLGRCLPAMLAPLALMGAGARLSGNIQDPGGRPVEAATVSLKSRSGGLVLAARSEGGGAYGFLAVPPGDYLLEAESPGLSLAEPTPITLAAGQSLQRDLTLVITPLASRVVVTTTATPLTLDETAKAASLVTEDEIDARDEYFLPEALRLVPGLQVRQLGGPGSLTNISIRGLRSTDTALLVDGLRMRDAADPQGSPLSFFENLLSLNQDQVEVLRGSGSSLYGTNAIGGVINVVSAPGGGAPHGEILAEGGGLGFLRGLGRFSGGARSGRLSYAGGFTHVNVVNGIFSQQPYRNTSGNLYVKHQIKPGLYWSGRLLASDAFAQLRDDPFVPAAIAAALPASGVIAARPLARGDAARAEERLPFTAAGATYLPSPADPDARRAGRFLNAALVLGQQVSSRFSYRAAYQAVDSRRRFDDGPGGIRYEPTFNNRSSFLGRTDTLEVRGDAILGRSHLLTGGYEFERERYFNRNSDANPDPAARTLDETTLLQRSHALYIQDQVRLFTDDLRLTLSGRTQQFQLTAPRFTAGPSPYAGRSFSAPPTAYTGDAALSYYLRPSGTRLRAHVGNAYRAPSLFERYGASFYLGFADALGDPYLRPERSLGLDTGIDQYLAGSKVKLSATWFYTALQSVIAFDFTGRLDPATDPWGRYGGYLNLNGGLARGAEFSASATPWDRTRVVAAYTYTNADPRAGAAQQADLLRAVSVPAHMGSLLVTQSVTRRLQITFDLSRTGSYYGLLSTPSGSRTFRYSGIAKGDLVAAYTVPVSDAISLRLHTKVENLFGQTYYQSGFYTPGRWAVGGLSLQF